MPLVDKPLSELYQYQGRNPRPDDFDAFWATALAEMHSIDPKVELRPAAFTAPNAECFDLYFDGVGGSRIHAKYLRPKQRSKPGPAVLQFHGYGADSRDWVKKLAYVGAGFCIATLDSRGQAGQSEDRGSVVGNTMSGQIIRGLNDDPSKLLFRQQFLDTAQLARIVMSFPEVDPDRVGAAGGSQGGGLTLACAALEPRIKRAAPVFPFLSDYQRVWEMDLAENAYLELKDYFRRYDPQHKREAEVFRKLGYIDIQHLAPRIRAEVLLGCGLMDRVCPPSTQFAAYNKITSPKSVEIFPDFGHERLPGFADQTFQFMLGL
jgi:cephalosporin-C deacetylase